MKNTTIIVLGICLISLASAELDLTIIGENWQLYSGGTYTNQIEVCHDLNESEILLSYSIDGNSYNMEGIKFNFSENPITFEGCKIVDFIISPQTNYQPDSFGISIIAMTSQSEKISFTTENKSIIYEDLNVELIIESDINGSIEIIKTKSNPKKNFAIPELGIFLDIKSDIVPNSTIIKVFYTDTEVNNLQLDESTLRLYYFNETEQEWIKYDGINGGVDILNNYIWAKTNHFSVWGAFGNNIKKIIEYRGGGRTKYVDRNITQNQTVYVIEYIDREIKTDNETVCLVEIPEEPKTFFTKINNWFKKIFDFLIFWK